MATFLQNIQDVCLELGLPSPSVVANNDDEMTKQLSALMNRVGDSLTTENDWQALIKEYRFQTVYYQYTGNIALRQVFKQLSRLAATLHCSHDCRL